MPPARLPSVGNKTYTVAGRRVWNILPEAIATSQSLAAFCKHLKT